MGTRQSLETLKGSVRGPSSESRQTTATRAALMHLVMEKEKCTNTASSDSDPQPIPCAVLRFTKLLLLARLCRSPKS